MFMVFDLLHRDGTEMLAAPYRERRAVLRDLGLGEHLRIQVPQYFAGVTGREGLDATVRLPTAPGR